MTRAEAAAKIIAGFVEEMSNAPNQKQVDRLWFVFDVRVAKLLHEIYGNEASSVEVRDDDARVPA